MKTKALLFAFSILLLTSCGNDDDNTSDDNVVTEAISQADIVGDYSTDSLTIDGEFTFTEGGETQTTSYQTTATMLDLNWSFNSSGTYTVTGSYTETDTETTNGQTTTETDVIDVNESGTFVVNSEDETLHLTIGGDEDPITFDIVSFTEGVLVLKNVEIDDTDNSVENLNITLSRM